MTSEEYVLGILWVVFVPANLYPFFYAFRPWWSTPQGRALMVKALGNAVLIDMILAVHIFGPDYPGRELIRVVGFTLFTVGMWYLLFTLLRSRGALDYPPFSWDRRYAREQEASRDAQDRVP